MTDSMPNQSTALVSPLQTLNCLTETILAPPSTIGFCGTLTCASLALDSAPKPHGAEILKLVIGHFVFVQ